MALPYSSSANLPYGSRIITIADTSASYVATNFRVSKDGRELERFNHLAAPNGFVLLDAPYRGTAELQVANTSIAFPNVSMTFSARVEQENANVNFVITGCGVPEVFDQFKNVEITFRQAA